MVPHAITSEQSFHIAKDYPLRFKDLTLNPLMLDFSNRYKNCLFISRSTKMKLKLDHTGIEKIYFQHTKRLSHYYQMTVESIGGTINIELKFSSIKSIGLSSRH